MLAARLIHQGRPLELVDTPVPQPGPGEIIVKLEACGVCHTDVHIRDGDEVIGQDGLPLTLGHEGIGIVSAAGDGVTSFSPGDRVGVPWLHDTCMTCRNCMTGHESVCASQRAHGMHVDGAFAEYVRAQEQFAVRIPEQLEPLTAAPLLCAGVTAFSAVKRTVPRPGETCVILGCGGLGQYGIQFAALCGAEIIAVDVDDTRLNVAKELGAHHVVRSGDKTADEINALGGMDSCINFAPTPHIWPVVEQTLNAHGRFVSVAMPKEPVDLSLTWLTWITPTITGSSVGTRQELIDTLEIAAKHNIKVPVETISLPTVDSALDRLAGRMPDHPIEGRLVIDFSESNATP